MVCLRHLENMDSSPHDFSSGQKKNHLEPTQVEQSLEELPCNKIQAAGRRTRCPGSDSWCSSAGHTAAQGWGKTGRVDMEPSVAAPNQPPKWPRWKAKKLAERKRPPSSHNTPGHRSAAVLKATDRDPILWRFVAFEIPATARRTIDGKGMRNKIALCRHEPWHSESWCNVSFLWAGYAHLLSCKRGIIHRKGSPIIPNVAVEWRWPSPLTQASQLAWPWVALPNNPAIKSHQQLLFAGRIQAICSSLGIWKNHLLQETNLQNNITTSMNRVVYKTLWLEEKTWSSQFLTQVDVNPWKQLVSPATWP